MFKSRLLHRNVSVLLTLALVLGFALPMTVYAVTSEDVGTGNVVISAGGDYSISGTTGSYTITVNDNVAATITLDGVDITSTSACAFTIGAGADVTLILKGSNDLKSGASYAGIYVAKGAFLTIEEESAATGSLTVTGGNKLTGYTGGGAGIGGNGINDGTNSFGTVTINGGTITAAGGATTVADYGGGAGIGSGGAFAKTAEGTIVINGGDITATGGQSDSGYGGAGIGSGGNEGHSGSFWFPQNSDVDVTITGGTVTAYGEDTAAGIGGGGDGHSGPITITGGKITAYGASEYNYGGAGIGGGGNGFASTVSIGGDAEVYAYGGGAAAGIGGGYCGGVGIFDTTSDYYNMQDDGEINIDGDAVVYAYGGTGTGTNFPGGAGIGNGANTAGYSVSSGIITIEGSAQVTAEGGNGGAGIGGGFARSSTHDNYVVSIIISGDAVVSALGSSHTSGGGAGIGGGGGYENWVYSIDISGGAAVNATGADGGAGIGGGYCGLVYSIDISGGAAVYATGADGGAGIGGGYKGWVCYIDIDEDAGVTAIGSGGGAGIGGGYCGGVWDDDADSGNGASGTISIGGKAVVTAFGGMDGGAGIGAGCDDYSGGGVCNSGSITISDYASVTAYGGTGAQAVGVGADYDYDSYAAAADENELIIDNTIQLRLFNADDEQPAHTKNVSGPGEAILLAYTLEDDTSNTSFPSSGANTAETYHTDNYSGSYTWEYSGSTGVYTLTLYDGTSTLATVASAHTSFSNWAVLLSDYTVTYDANGGVGSHSDSVSPGTEYTILSASGAGITRAGYAFVGWNTAADGTGMPYDPSDKITVNSDVTLYAQWKAITYTVTFESNGGTTVAPITDVAYNAAITAPTDPTKTDCTFQGWYKDVALTDQWDFATDTVIDNITLYAKWKADTDTYTVTFESNGGTAVAAITDVVYDTTITAPTAPTKSGYTFQGWYKEEALTNLWDFDTDTVTDNITLYAKWSYNSSGGGSGGTTTYTVTYNANGGTGSYKDTGISSGSSYSILTQAGTGISRDGYTFTGWNTKAGGGGTDYDPKDTITVTSSVTLYAQWEEGTQPVVPEGTYTVTYNPNGGTGTAYSVTEDVGDAHTVLSNKNANLGFTLPGSVFRGWSTNSSAESAGYVGSGSESVGAAANSGDTITLYAVWSELVDPYEDIGEDEIPLGSLDLTNHFAYIIGYPDGTVKPENNINRAEVSAIFFRLLTQESREALWSKTNSFPDVSATAWYNNAISTLANANVLKGGTDGTFAPNASITRAEFATIAARFAKAEDIAGATGMAAFSDISGHWAENYIVLAGALGYVEGSGDGAFRPDDPITRAEVATLLNRVLSRQVESAADMQTDMITWPDNLSGKWYYYAMQEATNSHFFDRKSDGISETWTQLRTAPDWAALEKPGAAPGDVSY